MSSAVMIHSSAFLLPGPPLTALDGDSLPEYALIVLNQKLPQFAPLIWERAQLRVCADGGANRLYDDMPELLPESDAAEVRRRYKPDAIKGDMDSIRTEVKKFYTDMVVEILDESEDQDTTDLHKCVDYVRSKVQNSNLVILVLGALGGRFDHEMGNINVLHWFSDLRIVLLSNDCLICLLPKTHRHVIHIHRSIEGPHCGVIPIGAPASSTTTTGLRWDLDNTAMGFGGLISTSNLVDEETITVQSDADLIWTVSLMKHSEL